MPHPARTIGGLAQLACTWEVLARKAGNVCPGREFPDLTVADFLKSAAAIAPVMDQAPTQPLGVTILRAIEATRQVVNTNTNLGIVLLLAPLASVPLDEPLQPGLSRVLSQTTVEDSRNAYAAIRLANPGGLGDVPEQDVKSEPTLPLRDLMALAKERDTIATQYVTEFAGLHDLGCELLDCAHIFQNIEFAIVRMHLWILANITDSLIRRKLGKQEAVRACEVAAAVDKNGLHTEIGRQAYRELDALLRADNHARNPGTTADLIAAALFVALREGQLTPDMPFAWQDHPFGV